MRFRIERTNVLSEMRAPDRATGQLAAAMTSDISLLCAVDLADALSSLQISARELMQASLDRIARHNPRLNALVTLASREDLFAQADAADEIFARGEAHGPLLGLPLGVKDAFETRGLRTTYGSPLFAEFVPCDDAYVVQREKAAGAIVVGKTNVPEFSLGSQTFNPVFGATRNPYDATKTCGGSTGGGSVAVACGMVALADGSDFGGSLRNPPNFCNVVGLRPSPGRIADGGYSTFPVSGPVGRTVRDVALLLSVQAGFASEAPLAIDGPVPAYHRLLERDFRGVRVALFTGLGLPWEPEVFETIRAQRPILEALGCIVEDAEPDLSDANEVFIGLRHALMEAHFSRLDVAARPAAFNAYVHWHIEGARALSGPALARLEARRLELFVRMQRFMRRYEFFVMPVSQVLPFDVSIAYPTHIAGVPMENYLAWMKSAWYISTVGNPALSVPAGFSRAGLPIGMQIVGRHHADLAVLQLGHAYESATGIGNRRPPD